MRIYTCIRWKKYTYNNFNTHICLSQMKVLLYACVYFIISSANKNSCYIFLSHSFINILFFYTILVKWMSMIQYKMLLSIVLLTLIHSIFWHTSSQFHRKSYQWNCLITYLRQSVCESHYDSYYTYYSIYIIFIWLNSDI